ncbi:glycosyltransferase family 2 protein [Actibacterium sp. D379-3]
MQPEPLISVVVPVYNRAHLVGRALGGLITQSYRNLDIIVVDDRSDDDIEGAIAAVGDSRVRLIRREKNGGAAAARNTGVAAARGDYIAFHDSDDVSLFDRFDRSMRMLQDNPGHIGVYTASIAHIDTPEAQHGQAAARPLPPPHRSPLSGDLFRETIRGNFIDLPTMLLRRQAVLNAGPFDERLRNNEDWDFTLRLTRQGPFAFIPQPLYIFSYQPRTAAGNDHLSQSTQHSTRSYVYTTGKLRRAGYGTRDLGGHYGSIASLMIRNHHPKPARRYLGRMIRDQTNLRRAATLYAFSFAPGFYARLLRSRGMF